MANSRQTRDKNGRFKADHTSRNRAIGIASIVGLGAAAVGAALRFGLLDRFFPAIEGHDAPDLALDQPHPGPGDRAPEAFRPDPTAVPTDAERESLRVPDGVDKGFMADDTRAEPLATVS
ncbi:MAG: hypothetical protein E7773_07645 [Sphingomonas sp.]|uniref:hypothetical protein n=1 Tax=Sphingomonas sp. TaxID=28214 RepID=UPI00121BEA60|nr:hypothetical protein [Sphingomonas sp.]THD36377.1 MAG: hypothetical protein E7773_07645 [Sphingomonas sp.]